MIAAKKQGQKGIISCFAFAPSGGMYACGSYSKSLGLYDERTGTSFAVMATPTGVTHARFSPDGWVHCLYCNKDSFTLQQSRVLRRAADQRDSGHVDEAILLMH